MGEKGQTILAFMPVDGFKLLQYFNFFLVKTANDKNNKTLN